MDLAGNAFNGAVLVAVLTAALSSFPWGQQAESNGMAGQSACSGAAQPAAPVDEPTTEDDGEPLDLCDNEGHLPPPLAEDAFPDLSLDEFGF